MQVRPDNTAERAPGSPASLRPLTPPAPNFRESYTKHLRRLSQLSGDFDDLDLDIPLSIPLPDSRPSTPGQRPVSSQSLFVPSPYQVNERMVYGTPVHGTPRSSTYTLNQYQAHSRPCSGYARSVHTPLDFRDRLNGGADSGYSSDGHPKPTPQRVQIPDPYQSQTGQRRKEIPSGPCSCDITSINKCCKPIGGWLSGILTLVLSGVVATCASGRSCTCGF